MLKWAALAKVEVYKLGLREVDQLNILLPRPLIPALCLDLHPELRPDHICIADKGLASCIADHVHYVIYDLLRGVCGRVVGVATADVRLYKDLVVAANEPPHASQVTDCPLNGILQVVDAPLVIRVAKDRVPGILGDLGP